MPEPAGIEGLFKFSAGGLGTVLCSEDWFSFLREATEHSHIHNQRDTHRKKNKRGTPTYRASLALGGDNCAA